MGFHVTQTGVVIGVNEGQMNLKVKKAAAEERGWDLGESANRGFASPEP